MKKVIFNYAIIAALALSAVCTSCKKDDDKNENGNGNEPEKVQLVKTITYSEGWSQNFEYDNENRITTTSYYKGETPMGSSTFLYSEDDLIKYIQGQLVYNFSKNGSKIDVSVTGAEGSHAEGTIELNNDGYPVMMDLYGATTFQYSDGNLISINEGSTMHTFQYDNKKSPFYNCKTPKWFLISIPFFESYMTTIKNNMTKITTVRSDETLEYECTYEYDDAGFATKMSSDGGYVITFKY
jgi:hypothetical protein